METSLKVKLLPSQEQQQLINEICEAYCKVVSQLVDVLMTGSANLKVEDIQHDFPRGVKEQLVGDALAIYEEYQANPIKSVSAVKKPWCKWAKDNVYIMGDMVAFPVKEGGKHLMMKAVIPLQYRERLAGGYESMKVHRKSNKFIGTFTVIEEAPQEEETLELEEAAVRS